MSMIAAAPATKLKLGRPLVAARAITGERLALVATAGAVAMLPLAIPQGPANMAPNDVFLALAIGACLLWAGAAGLRLQFPYVVPVTLAVIGGAAGALLGPVPLKGMFALTQDVWLIAWCWTAVNVSRTPRNLKVLLATWAYSGIAWAMLAFVGMATGNTLLTGQVPRQGSRVQITLDDPSYAANYFLISLMMIWATQRPKPRAARFAAYAL